MHFHLNGKRDDIHTHAHTLTERNKVLRGKFITRKVSVRKERERKSKEARREKGGKRKVIILEGGEEKALENSHSLILHHLRSLA